MCIMLSNATASLSNMLLQYWAAHGPHLHSLSTNTKGCLDAVNERYMLVLLACIQQACMQRRSVHANQHISFAEMQLAVLKV